ncbi:MAG: hypothetical protein LBM02_08675 [Lachnospiraceae bacterium]|jgi:Leucine-rich repeat (LRR) protein|nr:hypothetical protein [Lachnospiraceae bacterium]
MKKLFNKVLSILLALALFFTMTSMVPSVSEAAPASKVKVDSSKRVPVKDKKKPYILNKKGMARNIKKPMALKAIKKAGTTVTSGVWQYIVNEGGTATIVNNLSADVVWTIPEEIEGKIVTDINMHIPDTVTKVDTSATSTNLLTVSMYRDTFDTPISLDFSANINLTSLILNMGMSTLDVSHNTKLTTLNCSTFLPVNEDDEDGSDEIEITFGVDVPDYGIKTLDLSKNPELTYLDCSGNMIDSLNLDNNCKLTYLDCNANSLRNLNLSNNTALTTLNCSANELKDLNLDANVALDTASLYSNYITNLDVSKNINLTFLECSDNQISSLSLNNNTKLTDLFCANNKIKTIDLSSNLNLDTFFCYMNDGITSLNLASNSNLTDLDCSYCGIKSLDLSSNTKLTDLDCSYNEITNLNITGSPELINLTCDDNQLTTLDTTKNTKLDYLYCDSNPLTKLDVSNNKLLKTLYCSDDTLTSIDVRNLSILEQLTVDYNDLSSLDISKNTKLQYLDCTSNQLDNLNTSKNTGLLILLCGDNMIESLDLSKNLKMTDLDCSYNELSKLDVTKNTGIKSTELLDDGSIDVHFCCIYNNIEHVKPLVKRFTRLYVLPQNLLTDYEDGYVDTNVVQLKPLTKNCFKYDKSDTYNKKHLSANVKAKVSGIGKITTYYKARGSKTYTTKTPYKAGSYSIYVKTTAGKTYSARTSYLYIGKYYILPRKVYKVKVKALDNKLAISWKNYTTSTNNATYIRVYYKEEGKKWKRKTFKNKKLNKVTLKLKNKKKYAITIRTYRNGAFSEYSTKKIVKTL